MKTKEEQFRRLILSVGINTFVNYFYNFRTAFIEKDNTDLFEKLKKNNETWKDNSINAKATNGRKIFRLGYELDALSYIINGANVNKIGSDIKEKAKIIYNEYKKL